MIVEGARVFNVYRKRFEDKSVLVSDGVIAAVGAGLPVPSGELRLDASGAFLVPGLVDIHMHIESSMTIPSEFSRAVLPHGTTTVVADPHEIANVFGAEGIRAFMAAETALDIFWGLPSSVPSTNAELETTGGRIGADDLAALAADDRVLCLGEVMNAAELIRGGDSPTRRVIDEFRRLKPRFPVEGHCPRISGADLSAFIAAGVWADHTQQTPASIIEKIDNGMFMELQHKSIDAANIAAILGNGLIDQVCLVTDDVMPDQLETGHLNRLVALAVKAGMSAEDAIRCATYIPARHMGLRDRGAIAPGRIADFILLDDADSFAIRAVYKRGLLVRGPLVRGPLIRGPLVRGGPAPGGMLSAESAEGAEPKTVFPPHFRTSVRRKPLAESEFEVSAPEGFTGSEIACVAIKLDPKSTFTEKTSVLCAVSDGLIDWRSAGLSLIVAIERYGGEAPLRFGWVEGALTGEGAVATTWAHDHHNLLVMGTSVSDMVLAANTLIAQQGGYLVARDGTLVANAHLEIGGIVSDGPIGTLAREIRGVRKAMRALGYEHVNEIMSFSTLSLLVSPHLKISDKGLVDVSTQSIVENHEFPHI